MSGKMSEFYKPVAFAFLNIVSASSIVFANKAVMTTFGFHFIYALTLIHTLTTMVGMQAFAYFGMFEKKKLPKFSIASLAGAYVGYIVLNNLNLQMNTVGFYQISKIAVAPAVRVQALRTESIHLFIKVFTDCPPIRYHVFVILKPDSWHKLVYTFGLRGLPIAQVLAAEAVFFGKRASRKVVAAIVIVCMGVGLSTVTDTQVRVSMDVNG